MTIRIYQHPLRTLLTFFAPAVFAGIGIVSSATGAQPGIPIPPKKPVIVEGIRKPLDLKKLNPKPMLGDKQVKPVAPPQILPKDAPPKNVLPKDLVQKLQPKKPVPPKLPKDIVFNPQPLPKPAGPKDLGAKPNPKFPGPGDGKPGDLKPNEDNGNGGNGNGGGGNGNGGNGNNNDPEWLEWLAWLAWINSGHNHHHDFDHGNLHPPLIIVPDVPQVVVPLPNQPQAKRFEAPIGSDLPLGGVNFGPEVGYAVLQIGDMRVSLETPAWKSDAIVVRLPALSLLSAADADLHLYDVEGQYLTTVLLKLTPSDK